ncbi:hypothetical protein OG349_25780 [Streptomyces sp. NBC_01317]|uniref:hypothetical protein n=1 Tax=Streptomyces sp. NBC_01317 TaxID=2903822 RepID=UPI002E11FF11|nr:hypothetical protein OG349_25780 [Streptomyces sp. NBC_01317]
MSEARTDTTQGRPVPHGAADRRGDDGGIGKHRGGAAPTEDSASPAYGRHRRPEENSRAA